MRQRAQQEPGKNDAQAGNRGGLMALRPDPGRRGAGSAAGRAEALAAAAASGGKSAAFGDQEAVGGDAQGPMMMEAAPGTALEMIEPQFLLEFLAVALDAPAQLGSPDQLLERRGGGEVGQPILGGFGVAVGPLDEQPLLAMREGAPVVARWAARTLTAAKRERIMPAVPSRQVIVR
jgi:hypothetical protein